MWMNGKHTEEKKHPIRGRWTGILAAALITAGIAAVTGYLWQYYYDLNDDVLMKDILSGLYTGAPSSRNIQMLWPVSLGISLFYRLFDGIDWYAVFLLLCQFGSLFLILARILSLKTLQPGKGTAGTVGMEKESRKTLSVRILFAVSVLAAAMTMLLYHFVFVQYTVTTGMLAGAAAFLFITMPLSEYSMSPGKMRRHLLHCSMPSLLLIWLGYLLRSEMMLLLLPLVLCAALFRCLRTPRSHTFNRHGVGAVALVLAVMGAGLFLCQGANRIGYGSEKWQSFYRLFDARTQLYDFQMQVLDEGYEQNKTFYQKIGVDEETFTLLQNYNYGLSSRVDSNLLQVIADYGAHEKVQNTTVSSRMRSALQQYLWWHFGSQGRPYNVILWAAFLLALLSGLAAVLERENKGIFRETILEWALLFLASAVLWLYILYNGRAPDRITHSLFWVELIVAGGILLQNLRLLRTQSATAMAAVLACICLIFLPTQVRRINEEYDRRENINTAWDSYQAYCLAHPDCFYFTDVYSTVAYSEKMFAKADNDKAANHDIMGGWAYGSPLYEEKLSVYGITDMATALCTMSNVYLVVEKDSDLTWLTAWYQKQGYDIAIEKEEEIGSWFTVWKLALK